MLELKMVKIIKKCLPKDTAIIHKIETRTEIGVPDLYVRTKKKDIWIELKELKIYPKRAETTIKLPWRPGQLNWIHHHQQMGGSILLMVTYKDKWFLFKKILKEYTQEEFIALSIIPQNLPAARTYTLISILNQDT